MKPLLRDQLGKRDCEELMEVAQNALAALDAAIRYEGFYEERCDGYLESVHTMRLELDEMNRLMLQDRYLGNYDANGRIKPA